MALIKCPNCGGDVSDRAIRCPKCGEPLINNSVNQPSQQGGNNNRPAQGGQNGATTDKSNVVAGLLAIFLGTLGIHYFYIGKNKAGVVFLICGTAGWLIVLPAVAVAIVALITGIKMLIASQADFERDYVYSNKEFPI